jgi:hypothetical protein
MNTDAEGYGFSADDRLDRFKQDIRVLSPAGIERAARGWDRHVGKAKLEAFHEAEKAALHAIEGTDRWTAWDDIRTNLFKLTESDKALVAWRLEHGEVGHKAETAAQAAALGLLARDAIDAEQARLLLSPLAEALPWLLPEQAPMQTESSPESG